ADSGLTGTDNVIILEDGAGTMIDALAFANNDGSWAGAQQSAFNNIVVPAHWRGTVDGGAAVNEPQCADWSKGDGGKSLGRDSSSTDANSKTDWRLFTSQTPGVANPAMGTPGAVLINEVAPSEEKDWIELYNTSAGDVDIRYWVVKERTSVVKTFPSYAMTPGEYIVLNFDGDPAGDEVAGDTNGNGYRDFYTADSGLTGTDNVIILEDGASTMIDALAFANNDGSWADAQQTAFNNIVIPGHWRGTVDGGAAVNEPECADWSNGAKSRSLGRDAWSNDTDSKNDWYLSLHTKGEVNPGWPHSVTVTADPASIPADGTSTSTISAAVKDRNNNPVADGTTVVFATDLGALSDTTTKTIDGVATVTLKSGTVPGKARVTARSLWVSGQVSVPLTFIPTQIGARIQLPAIDNDHDWKTLIQVQNVGDEDTGAVAFFWGEYSGQCPNNDPGPIGVACMMLPENAVWTLRSQIPESARSAIVYSVDKDVFEKACEDADDAVDDSDDWKEWEDDYDDKDIGEPMAVIAQREGPNDYDTMVSSAYTGISEDMERSGPPYQYFAPYAMGQYYNLDTEMIIQNSGQRCTSVWLYYQKQGGGCRFSYSEHIELLAPGESIRKRVPEALGVGWLGSIYVTANEPLGIIMDQTSFPPSADRGGLLTHRAWPYKLTTDTLFYAGLVFRELSGWEASIQVQNLTQESLPTFVTVEFFDASGDSILYLGDWVCPAGGATFYLPAIAGLGIEYAGAAVIQSHSQVGYPGSEETDGQPIFAVVDLKKAGVDVQGGSYNAHAESENQGASVIMLPFLARDHQGVTSLMAIRNSSNCNDVKLKLEVRGETGAVVSFVDNFWLRSGHIKLVDLDSVNSVASGFAGAGIAEVTDVQQLCDMDGDGDADQEPLMLSVVVVNKGTGPGDVTWVYEGIPAR
ncbi:MAG: lamin tail domain-containing protein, partial [Anaerolineales bacterium]|nr:lamin tail domain-containing protein [Anaerolineales bacterium]